MIKTAGKRRISIKQTKVLTAMNLLTQGVRIIVREPVGWHHGNLFGYVVKQQGNRLFIKLAKPLRGATFDSDVMALEPRYPGDTFKPLEHNFTVPVKGSLVNTEDQTDYLIAGTVTID